MAAHGARPDLDPAARRRGAAARSIAGARAGGRRCASPSSIRIRATTTSCATGWPPAASIPDRDVEIVILPPPLMADALAAGAHRRLSASASPGTRAAVVQGRGRIATVKAAIWRVEPGKGAGRRTRAGPRPIPRRSPRCCARSTAPRVWCGDAGEPRRTGRAPGRPGLCRLPGRLAAAGSDRRHAGRRRRDGRRSRTSSCRTPRPRPFRGRATRCGSTRQMVRWGQVGARRRERGRSRASTYRPDLYRAALKPLGVRAARRQRQGRGRARRGRRRSARPARAWCSGRTASSTAQRFDPDRARRLHRRRRPRCWTCLASA